MSTGRSFILLLAALLLFVAAPAAASAASVEITVSYNTAFDKTMAEADQTQAGKLISLYNEMLVFQKQEEDLDARTKALHAANGEALSTLNKQIKLIDAAQLDKLEAHLNQTKDRYKSLFASYTALNKRIEAARILKNKTLGSLLRFQAGLLKIPVSLARAEIKMKDTALKTAKVQTAAKVKKIRDILAGTDKVNTQIKSGQAAIKKTKEDISPVLNSFKQAVKKRDVKSTLSTLASLVSLMQRIEEVKDSIYNLEMKISGILSAAKAQIP